MKSHRSAKKPSKNLNKSFKGNKLDTSSLIDEPNHRKVKKQHSKDPVSSHRSTLSGKGKNLIVNSNLRLKNMIN